MDLMAITAFSQRPLLLEDGRGDPLTLSSRHRTVGSPRVYVVAQNVDVYRLPRPHVSVSVSRPLKWFEWSPHI